MGIVFNRRSQGRSLSGITAAATGMIALVTCIAPPLMTEAWAQRVCAPGDFQCNQQRIQNTREDAVSRKKHHRRNDARSQLPQRYYGDRSSFSVTRPQSDSCDVAPVISGQDTRVVRSC